MDCKIIKKRMVLFVMILVPVLASAYDIEVANDDGVTIYYKYTKNRKELVVTQSRNHSYEGNIVIPEEVTYNEVKLKVSGIDYNAFLECSDLTSIIIPNSVTSIGSFAFSGCSNLKSINIPDGVTDIEPYAFKDCSNLTSIIIGNSMINIKQAVFQGCSNLTSIEFHCKEIKDWFYNNKTLQNVVIGDEVTNIGTNAFSGCSNLISVTIGNSVTIIWNGAFYNCSSLTSVTIPNSVTLIDRNVFQGCSSLATLSLGNSVNEIRKEAFKKCDNLTTIYFNCKEIKDWFRYCKTLQKIVVNDEVTSIEERAFIDCSSLTSATISNSVASIGGYAFSGCSSLTSVTIPNSVSSIEESTFYGCSSLTSITIPNSVTSIEKSAFQNCGSLTDFTIPNSVANIGESAFAGCSNLTSIIIPNSVTRIAESTFQNCSNLTSVIIPNSVTSIGKSAFYRCSNLSAVTIPNSVTGIGETAFADCNSLTSINIPNSVTAIGKGAFMYCRISYVSIPNSVTNIGKSAFTSLTTLEIHCSSVSDAFSGSSIRTVVFGDEVKTIANEAFMHSSVSTVVIGKSVYQIGRDAFAKSSGEINLMKTIWLCDTAPSGEIYASGQINYVKTGNFSWNLSNQEVCPLLDSSFEIDGIWYVPVSTTENTCDVIDCDFNCTIRKIPPTVTHQGVTMSVRNIKPYALLYADLDENFICENDGEIAKYAFYGCKMHHITLGEKITSIGDRAFKLCSSLEELVIPNSVKTIDVMAFNSCSSLTSVTIPKSVRYYGGGVFSECRNLTTVIVKNETPVSIKANDFQYRRIATLYVPIGSKTAYESAEYWKEFSRIVEGTGPNSEGETPADDLKDYIYEAGVNNSWGIPEQPLYSANKDGIYRGFFYAQEADWSGGKGAFKFTGAFNSWEEGNYGLGHINADGLSGTLIDDGGSDNILATPGFYRADVNLGNMTYELTPISSIGIIGPAQAGGWDTDTDLTYNPKTLAWEGTMKLAAEEFKFRANDSWDINWGNIISNLKQDGANLKIDEAGTYFIQFFPLCETKSYATMTLVTDQTSDDYPTSGSCGETVDYFYDKASHTLTISGKGAIYDYDKVNKAPWSSYEDKIQKIEINYGITSIGYFAFYKCSSVTSLSLPATVGYIGSSAFEDCKSLTSLSLNDGLLSIGGSAFEGCAGLKTLSIPSSVNTISINAFKNCKGITDVYCYAEAIPDTHFDAFDATPTEKATLHVPANSVQAYRTSWPWSDFKAIVSLGLSGDANGDGVVDGKDINAIADYIVKGKTEGFNFNNADVNGDQKVNVADIVEIINWIKK